MSRLLLLSWIQLIWVAIGVAQAPCDTALFNKCQTEFNTALNVGDNTDWSDPYMLKEYITKVMIRGTPGLLQVCSARTELWQCLGPEQYYACLNVLYFIDQGFNTVEAYEFVGVTRGLDFLCIGGFNVAVENWPCFIHVFVREAAALDTCSQTYFVNVQVDYDNLCKLVMTAVSEGNVPYFCSNLAEMAFRKSKHAQELIDCYGTVFHSSCSYNNQSSWWSCEYIVKGYQLDMRCPGINCPVETKMDPNTQTEPVIAE